MTPEQAAALRVPFPREQIGQLPRGGIMLDYVGHAATTDRLLQVDPEWTWVPAAVGPNGEPLIVDGGLWIKLTVAGVTRYGYGDGPTVKEMIGDAIRNAAMRFGVALDLWARDGLGQDQPRADGSEAVSDAPKAVTNAQHAKIGVLVKELMDISEREPDSQADWVGASREFCLSRFGKHSRAELTTVEAGLLIDWLEEQVVIAKVPFG